jgi:hypothetical protein
VRYTVTWNSTALNELAEIWLSAPDRDRVAQAAALVDRILSDDPQSKGDDFYGDRILVVGSIEITFKVLETDRIVRVGEVRGR